MIYLAPNVYVLGYLSATKQLSGNSEENAYRFIQSGEFRVMAFKFNAGSILFGYFCLIKASPLRHTVNILSQLLCYNTDRGKVKSLLGPIMKLSERVI